MSHQKTQSEGVFPAETIVLVLIVSLAAILRLWDLDRTSLFHDEGVSFYQSNRGFLDMLRETAKDNYPPLHNLILWVTIKLVGTSETILRLPSAFLGIAAVYAIYQVAGICGPRGSGLFAAALLALLPMHIWHSTEVRMYSLLTFAAICFIWSTLAHFRQPTRMTTMLCAFMSWVLLMSHVYGSFAVASIFAYVFATAVLTKSVSTAANRSWLLSQICAGMFFLPWIVVLLGRSADMHSSGFWIPVPTAEFILRHLVGLFGAAPLIALAVLAVMAVYKILIARTRATSDTSGSSIGWTTGLLLSWLIGPFIMAYFLSITVLPILYNRYLLVAAPAGLVLIACGVMRLQITSLAKAFVALVIIGFQIPTALTYALSYQGERHDFRSTAHYMMSKYRQGDIFIPVEYYFATSISYYTGNLSNVVKATSPDAYSTPPEQAKRVWFMFSWSGLKLKATIIDKYEAAGFSKVVDKQYHDTSLILMEKHASPNLSHVIN